MVQEERFPRCSMGVVFNSNRNFIIDSKREGMQAAEPVIRSEGRLIQCFKPPRIGNVMNTELLIQDPEGIPRETLVLAHGAGAPMDSPFMEHVSRGLVAVGIRVVRFEFPYMNHRRQTGKKSPPNSMKILVETWREVICSLGAEGLFIGGKSMGGRVASVVADHQNVAGLVCLGYPFHPPGKPEKTRTDHLVEIKTPTLICQGERDPFGGKAEVGQYNLSGQIEICWIPDGEHSFKPRKNSGTTLEANMEECIVRVSRFIKNETLEPR